MSAARNEEAKEAPKGTGPGGRVELTDIKAKLVEIRGEVDQRTDRVRPYLTYAVVAGAVVVVAAAFLLGRRRGQRAATWVEIKRR